MLTQETKQLISKYVALGREINEAVRRDTDGAMMLAITEWVQLVISNEHHEDEHMSIMDVLECLGATSATRTCNGPEFNHWAIKIGDLNAVVLTDAAVDTVELQGEATSIRVAEVLSDDNGGDTDDVSTDTKA